MPAIFLNTNACAGRALRKWNSVEPALRARLGDFVIITADEYAPANLALELSRGENFFIAAGGDGTVNVLLNCLAHATHGAMSQLAIGAVGIGSSNDFHKPLEAALRLAEIPCRIDRDSATLRTIGSVRWSNGKSDSTHVWINNASVGITAEANHLFNNPNWYLRGLKKFNTDAAIVGTALRTIAAYRNLKLEISFDGGDHTRAAITNLGVILNPHFAGSFHYDTQQILDDDFFFVQSVEGLRRISTLRLLAQLAQGKFQGQPHTTSRRASRLAIRSRKAFAVEFDGEVIRTNVAEFTLQEKGVMICSR